MRPAWLILFSLAACTAGQDNEPSWAANDPSRPMMMAAEREGDARQFETAARECGIRRVQRLERDGLHWIILHDLPIASLDNDTRFQCAMNWSLAHPEVRLFFFGNEARQ